jgi:hypothetical protein
LTALPRAVENEIFCYSPPLPPTPGMLSRPTKISREQYIDA